MSQERGAMPKLKTKSGAKKRFQVSASGLIKASASGKRHNLRKRPQKMKRYARGTMVLASCDAARVRKHYLRIH